MNLINIRRTWLSWPCKVFPNAFIIVGIKVTTENEKFLRKKRLWTLPKLLKHARISLRAPFTSGAYYSGICVKERRAGGSMRKKMASVKAFVRSCYYFHPSDPHRNLFLYICAFLAAQVWQQYGNYSVSMLAREHASVYIPLYTSTCPRAQW